VDRKAVSTGIDGAQGEINAPTVFNSGLNFSQFWDGRAATLEEQVAGPIHNPVEMGSNWSEVIAKLKGDAGYLAKFSAVYPDGITAETIADAIATFERTLVTPSRFDRFLQGDESALNAHEKRGHRLFIEYGCASCHQGAGIGGNLFHLFGVMPGYFKGRLVSKADLGRFNVTAKDRDRHVFKVPSLRNVALTYPYFHDGSASSLNDAVVIMARYQLGIVLPYEDVGDIVAFLNALTGEWEGKLLE
jgi:cytochrome c peroxidase